MRQTDQVAVCFFGDGAANRGPVHEVMNLAVIWKLPIVFVVENNQFASTTAHRDACAVEDISLRAKGYSMPGTTVDGNDLLLVRKAAETAVLRARKGEGPSLIENKTYRIRGHFEGDPQKYRRPAEVALWEDNNDPIARFSHFLTQKKILTENIKEDVWREVAAQLSEAVAFADQSPFPEPEEALEDLLTS
ncbi:MAG: thiamine pyrophosphate-dependent dehydrogenase E1 component subunit alpha [Desulfobacterales bacterium]